ISFFPQTSPNPNVYFVGRSFYLHSLAKILKGEPRGSGPMRGAILTGIGGSGKTQLATEFIYRYGAHFAGGVFWLNFADAGDIPAQVIACSIELGMEQPSGKKPLPETVIGWVRSAWQSPLPRLLIFDNCEEEDLLEQW